MANFCCPIETEPKTLNQGQLSIARENALDIVHKKEPPLGAAAFSTIPTTEPHAHLKSVIVGSTTVAGVIISDAKHPNKAAEGYNCREQIKLEETINCQCSSSALTMESSPENCSRVKEPLSAPF